MQEFLHALQDQELVVDVARVQGIIQGKIDQEMKNDLKYSQNVKKYKQYQEMNQIETEATQLKIALFSQTTDPLRIRRKLEEIIKELEDPISPISLLIREQARFKQIARRKLRKKVRIDKHEKVLRFYIEAKIQEARNPEEVRNLLIKTSEF